jgi:toxin ParE1/3/4
MPRIFRTPQANEDLLGIWKYIAIDQQNPAIADHVLRELDATVHLLAENPLLGQSIERYRPELRMFTRWRYIIFFQPIANGIQIFRILHGARAWEELI